MMWQKKEKNGSETYHLIWNVSGDLNGHKVMTACGESVQMDIADQKNIFLVPGCAICVPIWHLIGNSAQDAIRELGHITDLIVLQRSQELTKSKTLRRAIAARIRKIGNGAKKARKLRLIQQAYD